jgi:hypothetical protein
MIFSNNHNAVDSATGDSEHWASCPDFHLPPNHEELLELQVP